MMLHFKDPNDGLEITARYSLPNANIAANYDQDNLRMEDELAQEGFRERTEPDNIFPIF